MNPKIRELVEQKGKSDQAYDLIIIDLENGEITEEEFMQVAPYLALTSHFAWLIMSRLFGKGQSIR